MKECPRESVVGRLDRLERANRRWKLSSLTTLAALALIAFAARTQQVPKKITASEIIVVDKNGNPESPWLSAKAGPSSPSGRRTGPPRLLMGLRSELGAGSPPFLNFRTEAGSPRLLMGLSADIEDGLERPYFNLTDKHGLGKFLWGLGPGDKPYFQLCGSRPDAALALGLSPDDESFIILRDDSGNDSFTQFGKRHRVENPLSRKFTWVQRIRSGVRRVGGIGLQHRTRASPPISFEE